MKKVLFLASFMMTVSAHAGTAPPIEPAKIDFTKRVTDPKGHAITPCSYEKCVDDQTVGLFVYIATSMPEPAQRQMTVPDPQRIKLAALGSRLYAATEPVALSDAERVLIRKALFNGILAPGVAYATCTMIGDPKECDQ
jgi:hypothetical protein